MNQTLFVVENEAISSSLNQTKTSLSKKTISIITISIVIIFLITIVIVLPLVLKTNHDELLLNINNTITSTTVMNINSSINISYDYTSELTSKSQIFYRLMSLRKHYYQSLKINVSITGNYTFTSISDIDTYGLLFYNEFYPLMFCKSLIQENDDIIDDVFQFQIQSILQSSLTYILVVTTFYSNTTGTFSIFIQGPGKVQIIPISTIELSPDIIPLIHPNDSIHAIYNTTVGSDSTPSVPYALYGSHPINQGPEKAIDNDTTTVYANLGECIDTGYGNLICGLNSGFYITLQKGLSVVKAFQLCVADDYVRRDPTRITLEGSNQLGLNLTLGSSWNLIFKGSVGYNIVPLRFSCSLLQCINNSISYTSYRFLITDKRGDDCTVQYSEVQFYGY